MGGAPGPEKRVRQYMSQASATLSSRSSREGSSGTSPASPIRAAQELITLSPGARLIGPVITKKLIRLPPP